MTDISTSFVYSKSYDIFLRSLLVAAGTTAATYFVGLSMGFIKSIYLLEIASVFTSYSCTYMCVKRTRWNYPMGLLSVILLAWFFSDLKLYASMSLQIYLIPWMFYGFFRWKKDSDPRPVTSIFSDKPAWIAAYVIALFSAYFIMENIVTHFGGKSAPFDSAIFALSIAAQFLLDNKKYENWIIWIGVNIISIVLYFNTGAYLLAMQFILFLGYNVAGLISWKSELKS